MFKSRFSKREWWPVGMSKHCMKKLMHAWINNIKS